jgi:tRNA(fMet)-specific endonuclease VapC
MGLMLDTSVLIEAERGKLALADRLVAVANDGVWISAVTASEMLHGVHRARTQAQRSKRDQFVEWVLREIPVAEFGLSEARVHAELWAGLLGRGQVIGAHDLMIAATALALGFRLATANRRNFGRVKDLTLEIWTDDAD